jgi:hypothetical protein
LAVTNTLAYLFVVTKKKNYFIEGRLLKVVVIRS